MYPAKTWIVLYLVRYGILSPRPSQCRQQAPYPEMFEFLPSGPGSSAVQRLKRLQLAPGDLDPTRNQGMPRNRARRGWVPTHTDRFTQETDTQDTGANSNHMLSGNFGSISSIMMDHSIASMSATLGSEIHPSILLQAETKRPTSNEHFKFSGPIIRGDPKERTPQQFEELQETKNCRINSSMPPLRPEKIMKQISQMYQGYPVLFPMQIPLELIPHSQTA
ncbi:hypothetical protein H4Q26_005354 [Puccinia striiformis f. sp. tritici PST-130]|nr:hypothetical protein H4Q26_005354 [Puccinia striiformis f. sp. tritici PST-130]